MSSIQEQSSANSQFSLENVLQSLEDKSYLKPDFNQMLGVDNKSQLEQFTAWFNSTFRINILKCDDQDESETFIYMLLNLKKSIKYALSELSKSVSNQKFYYKCKVCNQVMETEPGKDIWESLQDHEHFEEAYQNRDKIDTLETNDSLLASAPVQLIDKTSECCSTSDSIKGTVSPAVTNGSETSSSEQDLNLNNFKFNFAIPYDQRIETTLYPKHLMTAAQKLDQVTGYYTVQRSGPHKAECLLCPCSLNLKGKVLKINPFTVKCHVSGKKHLRLAANAVNISALRSYHEFWRGQEPNYQAHQVYFFPDINTTSSCRCVLCQRPVHYSKAVKHIVDDVHKCHVLKLYGSPENRQETFFLMDMQVKIYNVTPNESEMNGAPKKNEGRTVRDSSAGPKCVIIKSVLAPLNETQLAVPDRFKEHLPFFVKNHNSVFCNSCKLSFSDDLNDVRNHILSVQHRQLSGVVLNSKFKFFCEICSVHFKDEVLWDAHFAQKPVKHTNIAQSRINKVTEYECKTCLLVIYGDEVSLSRHMSSVGLRSAKKKEVKLPYPVKNLFKSKSSLEEEARRLQLEANRVAEYQEKMKDCCEDLEGALSEIYPNSKTYPFGSRISGLGNNRSDLDLFMDMGGMYTGEQNQDPQSQEQFVKKAGKLLMTYKEDFYYVVPIPSARTPIVKLHHCFTDLDCDISFRHGLGVENTKFLKYCIDLQPITQRFILLLKKWSDYCKLNEHITNYALALLAIFYLQTGGYLLSVKTVRIHNPQPSLVIDGWETINYTVPLEQMRQFVKPFTSSLKQLLRDFFFYCSKFDYANDVVCPLLGHTVAKMLFTEPGGARLPPEMKSYIQRLQKEDAELFRALSPFCIQDPFDLSHNLTKACQSGTCIKFKSLCTLTYEFLDTIE